MKPSTSQCLLLLLGLLLHVVVGSAAGAAAPAPTSAAAVAAAPIHLGGRSDRRACKRALQVVDKRRHGAAKQAEAEGRPVVTLAYAQTLDGCLAWAGRHAAEISCPQALAMTHGLRASHDCILVGAGTLQQDNPHLGVRLPTRRWRWGWLLGWRRQCRSPDPRPVVLVSAVPQEGEAPPLSSSASIPSWWWWGQPKPAAEPPPLPFDPAALRLARPPIVFTPDLPQLVRRLGGEAAVDALKADGWDFVACAAAEENGDSSRGKGKGHHRRCDVRDCLRRLKAEFGCRSVMVEGGARVLTACLRAGVVDVVCLTVAPAIMAPGAGHRAIQGGLTKGRRGGVRAWLARFKGREWELLRVGTDAVLVGVPERSRLC